MKVVTVPKYLRSLFKLKPLTLIAFSTAALFLASCGSSSDSGSSDTPLANFAPTDSEIYLEVDLRPEGAKKADLEAAISKISGLAPGEIGDKLIEEINKQKDTEYKRDIEPWLGSKAALYANGLTVNYGADASLDEPEEYALIIESKNSDAAQKALDREKDTEDASYEGTDYKVDTSDNTVAAVIDKTVVIGNEKGLKAVIDTKKGSENLNGSDTFKTAVEGVQNKGIAYMYFDWTSLLEQLPAAAGLDPASASALKGITSKLSTDEKKPLVASISANADKLSIDVQGPGSKTSIGSNSESSTLASLPENSLIAMSIPGYGKALNQSLKQSLGPQLDLVNQQLAASGLDLDKDIFSWMEDISIFAALDPGDKANDIYGALTISSSDPATSKNTVKKLEKIAKTAGQSVKSIKSAGATGFTVSTGSADISIFATDDSVVVGVGKDIVKQVQSPGSELANSKEFSAASEALADKSQMPLLFINFSPITTLVKEQGTTEAKDIKTLEAFSYFTIGAAVDNDKSTTSLIAGLK